MSYYRKGKDEEKGLSKRVVEGLANFGFGKGKMSDNQYLDTRCDIESKTMFQSIFYYRALEEYYGSSAAGIIANVLERLSLSKNRLSRKEVVMTLVGATGAFTRPEELVVGYETLQKKIEDTE